MFARFSPFLGTALAVVVLCAKGNASFVSPDALPEVSALWSAVGPSGASVPANEESPGSFWREAIYLGFLLFADVSELSAAVPCDEGSPSSEPLPVPQQGCLDAEQVSCADVVAWLAEQTSLFLISPYVCRLFRPPRATLPPSNAFPGLLAQERRWFRGV
jgi:hypothetical protein